MQNSQHNRPDERAGNPVTTRTPGVLGPRLLVALDGSQQSSAALRTAVALARLAQGSIHALHVATSARLPDFLSATEALRTDDAARSVGEKILEEAGEMANGLEVVREIQYGDPATQICRRARELNVDLVVVGSRKTGMLDRVLFGSVSSAVAERAPCSVLVVRETTSSQGAGT